MLHDCAEVNQFRCVRKERASSAGVSIGFESMEDAVSSMIRTARAEKACVRDAM